MRRHGGGVAVSHIVGVWHVHNPHTRTVRPLTATDRGGGTLHTGVGGCSAPHTTMMCCIRPVSASVWPARARLPAASYGGDATPHYTRNWCDRHTTTEMSPTMTESCVRGGG